MTTVTITTAITTPRALATSTTTRITTIDPVRPTRARYVFLLYAAALSLILYLARICISQSAGAIAGELSLNKFKVGCVFAAFVVGYTLFQIPSGTWGDRYGPRRVLCWVVVCWSLFTVLTGCVGRFTLDSGYRLDVTALGFSVPLLVNGFLVLLLVRFLFGVSQAGAYPSIARCSARWFPLSERGLAQGVVATAGRLGGGIAAGATLAIAGTVDHLVRLDGPPVGWRVSFAVFGTLGLVWVVFFTRWFRDAPAEHPSVNAAELALIEGRAGGEAPPEPQRMTALAPAHAIPWRALLTSTNLGALSFMAFCSAFAVYLYYTHFPDYLKERHDVPTVWGWVAGLPMIGGAAGCTLGGLATDWLVRRTGSRRWGRRLVGLAGKGGGAVLLLAGALANDPVWAVVLITLAAFTSDLAVAAHWALCTDTGGRFVATVFGIMNMVAGLGATLSPLVAGYLLDRLSPADAAGHFDAAARARAWDLVLYLFAATLAVSALCWLRIDAEEVVV
jgi:MFS family permease